MRHLGLLVVSSVTCIAFVGCRIDYDEVSNLLLAGSGGVPQGGSTGTGAGGTLGGTSMGGEAGEASGVGGANGGTAGGKGNGGTATSGGTGNAGGTAGSGTGGTSASGGAGGSGGTGGSTGTGGSGGGAGSGGASGGTAGGTGGGTAGTGGSSGSNTGGASGSGGSNGGSSGQSTGGSSGSGGSAGAPTLPDCMTADFNGSTYLLCAPEITWTAARDACASVGMELARVDDATENQWLFDNAYDLDALSDGLSVGGSDEAVEGEWRWTDGTLFWLGDDGGTAQGGLYTNWYNNHPGGNSLNDCLVIDLDVGTSPGWYSDRCSAGTNVFACETP